MKLPFRNNPRLGRWLQCLPGTSSRFGPPRTVATAQNHARAHSGTLIEATPARPLIPAPIQVFGRHNPWIAEFSQTVTPAVHIGCLPGGRLLWPEYSVVTADDTLLLDTSFLALCDHGGLHRHPLGARWRAPLQHRLDGRVLAITSDFAQRSFGHMVLDALPRLHHLRNAGLSVADFDWIVLPGLRSPTLDRLCDAAAIPSQRIYRTDTREDLVCDELTYVTFPGSPGVYPAETPEFYRRLLKLPAAAGHRRIYLSRQRQARRRLTNEAEIESLLARNGFETVFPETDADTIRKCSEAAIIVGIEGSNMVNQVFAPPGGTVVLMVDDQWRDLPYVRSLAMACGNRFMAAVGEARDVPADHSHWSNLHNLHLPPETLEAAIQAAVRPVAS
ncbi:MAG: DUF563 domain-containing protein [Rariglobus sp.]